MELMDLKDRFDAEVDATTRTRPAADYARAGRQRVLRRRGLAAVAAAAVVVAGVGGGWLVKGADRAPQVAQNVGEVLPWSDTRCHEGARVNDDSLYGREVFFATDAKNLCVGRGWRVVDRIDAPEGFGPGAVALQTAKAGERFTHLRVLVPAAHDYTATYGVDVVRDVTSLSEWLRWRSVEPIAALGSQGGGQLGFTGTRVVPDPGVQVLAQQVLAEDTPVEQGGPRATVVAAQLRLADGTPAWLVSTRESVDGGVSVATTMVRADQLPTVTSVADLAALQRFQWVSGAVESELFRAYGNGTDEFPEDAE